MIKIFISVTSQYPSNILKSFPDILYAVIQYCYVGSRTVSLFLAYENNSIIDYTYFVMCENSVKQH